MREYFKSIKFRIELLWSFLGGIVTTVGYRFLEVGSPEGSFRWEMDIFRVNRWDRMSDPNIGNFIFGFVITGIIIWSVKKYQKS